MSKAVEAGMCRGRKRRTQGEEKTRDRWRPGRGRWGTNTEAGPDAELAKSQKDFNDINNFTSETVWQSAAHFILPPTWGSWQFPGHQGAFAQQRTFSFADCFRTPWTFS